MKGVEVERSQLDHPCLHTTIVGRAPDRTFEVYSTVSPNVQWEVPNNSIENLREGVLQRVLYHKEDGIYCEPSAVDPSRVAERLNVFSVEVSKRLTPTARISYDQVLLSYSGRKLNRYTNARDSLLESGITPADARVSAFLKLEKSKVGFVPRVVSPRRPRYNLELLTFLQRLEHRMFSAIDDTFGDVTIFKGMNCVEQGVALRRKWDRFSHPVAVGFDATRFDQHVNCGLLQFEHSMYLKCYMGEDRDELAKLLDMQLNNRVVGYAKNGKLEYRIKGTRMSGDVNTSLGNCIIMCSIVFSYCATHDIEHYELANNGDDCVVIVEKHDLHKLKHFAQFCKVLGLLMVVEEPTAIFEEIKFCQCSPVLIGDTYRMLRFPMIAMSKDSISTIARNAEVQRRKWISCVGQSGLSMSGGVPVFQSFYSALCRNAGPLPHKGKPYKPEGGLYWLSKRMNDNVTAVTDAARLSFWKAFNIDTAQQLLLEKHYDSVTFGFGNSDRLLYCPWLNG